MSAVMPPVQPPTLPLGQVLRGELRRTLDSLPGVRAVWLGLGSGVTLAAEGSTDARHRLLREAPAVLAAHARAAAPAPVHPAGPHDVVAVVPVDEEKWLLALAPAPALAADGIRALEASASRLAASFDAWAVNFAFPEDPA